MKSLWEKLFKRESKLQRSGIHTQPQKPRLVWLWERESLQVARSWATLEVEGKCNHFWKRPQVVWVGPGGRNQKEKGPGASMPTVGSPVNSMWGEGHSEITLASCAEKGQRHRALLTEGRTDRRTACLEASATASHTQALARAGRCVRHQGVARLTEEARTFVKGGCTPLPRGKPRAGAMLLQDSQHAAQGLWSSGALEPWPGKGDEVSGIPLGEGSVSRGERGAQMQTPGAPVKPFNGSLWPAACESLS